MQETISSRKPCNVNDVSIPCRVTMDIACKTCKIQATSQNVRENGDNIKNRSANFVFSQYILPTKKASDLPQV